MKKVTKLLFLIFTITISSVNFGQQIKYEKIKGSNYKFTKGEKELLNFNEVINSIQDNPDAYKIAKKSKSNRTIGTVTGLTGSALIGFFLGGVIGGDNNWTIGGIGLGLFALEFPFASSAKKNIFKAVDVYNSSLKTDSTDNHNIDTKLVLNPNGLGIKVNF